MKPLSPTQKTLRASARPALPYLPATPISSQASATTIFVTLFWLQAALAVAVKGHAPQRSLGTP